MKKYLQAALTSALVLGTSLTALAANPFVDVPASHWAYESVSKLAGAGIVDGYGDGRFLGTNTMTRYEMAQIIAKALAKIESSDYAQRAQIQRLAAEFADELDSLGVRVANLEKNADNVKINAQIRYGNYSYSKNVYADKSLIRSRIWLTGQVNERWQYGGMLENNGHNFKTNTAEDTLRLRRAWVDGRLGTVNVTAGRFAYTPVFGIVLDNDGDGIKFNYQTGKLSMDAFAYRAGFSNYTDPLEPGEAYTGNNQILGGLLSYTFDERTQAQVAYYNLDGQEDNQFNDDIWEVALSYKVAKDLELWGEYIRGGGSVAGQKVDKDGFAGGLRLGAPNRSKPGSWGLRTAYYDVPAAGNIATTVDLDLTPFGDGFRGYQVGGSWVPAKNIDINVDYYDYKSQGELYAEKIREKLLFSYIRFFF